MQRFTPRRKGSNWSKVNVEKVAKLEAQGLMTPAGRKVFAERRKQDPVEPTRLPDDFERRLRANERAAAYFDSRPSWYRRTATRWVVSAKRENTRERRLHILIDSSARGEDVPPLRRR
jgi:uncharacterized protein YdeI (YjbR/CyaY-like superfamily)